MQGSFASYEIIEILILFWKFLFDDVIFEALKP